MERYKLHLFEMANIPPVRTGLKGIVQIRPEERHIFMPHIHYVRNVKKAEIEFLKITLSKIEDKIEILENKNFKISTKELKQLKIFITHNYKKLHTYYSQAELILDSSGFLANFEKI